jgi:N-acyl-D-amino-acid deacylase
VGALTTLLRGGWLVDGAGNPATRADVGVVGDRIAAIGDLSDADAGRIIDLDGGVVAPGFIDMHTHSDLHLLSEPSHEAKTAQGVTLEVLGQDGLSYAPVTDETLAVLRAQLRGWNGDPDGFHWDWRTVGEYLDRLDTGIAVNAAYLIPHGTVRLAVVGYERRESTDAELAEMRRLVAQGMREGAVGVSSGLTYAPGMYASDDELVALCETVAAHGGYYCPHHRNYGAEAIKAYADCVSISKRSGVPLHLTHAHMSFPANRGRAGELVSLIDEARRDGIEVTLDSYPYLAGNTYLHALLPGWAQEGGPEQTLERLRDLELREDIRREIEESGNAATPDAPFDWSTVVVSGVTRDEHRSLVASEPGL